MITAADQWGLADDDAVLVVEDNDGDARLVELMLIEAFGPGITVLRADSQARALSQLTQRVAACVLLDLGLPDGDGVDTVRRVVSWAPSAAIVVLTGDSSADTITAAVSAGAQDYLVKGQASAESVGRAVRYALLRKRTELKSAEALSQLPAIVNSTTDAILGKTLDGVITSWNAGATNMYGYTADEMIGRNVSELVPADSIGDLAPSLERVRSGEAVKPYDTTRRRKDGSIVEVSVAVAPIRDATGVVVGASTVTRDVTERNRTNAARRVLEDRLHQAERLESLAQLAGGIAHDFNNLLAVIINYVGFIAEQTTDLEDVQADVARIRTAAERAATLTRQLLTFAQRDALRPEALDLNGVVTGVINLLTRRVGAHIELRTDLAPELPWILADRGQMEQVLLNLAVNASDALPDGGTLTITTRSPDRQIDDGTSEPHVGPTRDVELTVSDTGVGMTEEEQAHIFEPFFTTKAVGQGRGLGLATVYGAVAEAGGTISVRSDKSHGTTFSLRFPGAPGAGRAAIASVVASSPEGQGQTILVVDDEPALLELTARILRRAGYVVLEAGTFDRALTLGSTDDFHLLLTDIVMPDMPGRTLAGHLDQVRPGRPVLYMSGYTQDMLSTDGVLDAGVALLHKPFDRGQLLEAVRDALAVATP